MSQLEQEIKSKFYSIEQRAFVNFMYTYTWHANEVKKMLKEYALTQQQYNVLRILRGQHPNSCTPNYVKEVMIDKSPDLTRLLDRLVIKGLINRDLNPENRRSMNVKITDQGLQKLSELDEITEQDIRKIFESVTEEELHIFNAVLDKMRR